MPVFALDRQLGGRVITTTGVETMRSATRRPAVQRSADRVAAVGVSCELAVPAITGPSWSAQNFPRGAALDDWFTAANLNSALARPGQLPSSATVGFLTSQFAAFVGSSRE